MFCPLPLQEVNDRTHKQRERCDEQHSLSEGNHSLDSSKKPAPFSARHVFIGRGIAFMIDEDSCASLVCCAQKGTAVAGQRTFARL